eukprot:GHVT01033218.1.p1 GENE.GHVT01033218.1~~GHVT01033218.1.p1  ORF type:complete len:780 (-),score=111.81 GHVT01033218.1:411-2750(-)
MTHSWKPACDTSGALATEHKQETMAYQHEMSRLSTSGESEDSPARFDCNRQKENVVENMRVSSASPLAPANDARQGSGPAQYCSSVAEEAAQRGNNRTHSGSTRPLRAAAVADGTPFAEPRKVRFSHGQRAPRSDGRVLTTQSMSAVVTGPVIPQASNLPPPLPSSWPPAALSFNIARTVGRRSNGNSSRGRNSGILGSGGRAFPAGAARNAGESFSAFFRPLLHHSNSAGNLGAIMAAPPPLPTPTNLQDPSLFASLSMQVGGDATGVSTPATDIYSRWDCAPVPEGGSGDASVPSHFGTLYGQNGNNAGSHNGRGNSRSPQGSPASSYGVPNGCEPQSPATRMLCGVSMETPVNSMMRQGPAAGGWRSSSGQQPGTPAPGCRNGCSNRGVLSTPRHDRRHATTGLCRTGSAPGGASPFAALSGASRSSWRRPVLPPPPTMGCNTGALTPMMHLSSFSQHPAANSISCLANSSPRVVPPTAAGGQQLFNTRNFAATRAYSRQQQQSAYPKNAQSATPSHAQWQHKNPEKNFAAPQQVCLPPGCLNRCSDSNGRCMCSTGASPSPAFSNGPRLPRADAPRLPPRPPVEAGVIVGSLPRRSNSGSAVITDAKAAGRSSPPAVSRAANSPWHSARRSDNGAGLANRSVLNKTPARLPVDSIAHIGLCPTRTPSFPLDGNPDCLDFAPSVTAFDSQPRAKLAPARALFHNTPAGITSSARVGAKALLPILRKKMSAHYTPSDNSRPHGARRETSHCVYTIGSCKNQMPKPCASHAHERRSPV